MKMTMMKRWMTGMMFSAIATLTFSQQLPIYSQYMMNGFLLNPAVAGHEGYTAVNVTARDQWLGIKDAPSTYAISAQSRLLKNSFVSREASMNKRKRMMSRSGRVGYGFYAFTDMAGAFNRTGIQGTYSYHIPLNKSQLSFGISVTGYQFGINDSKIRLMESQDELLLKTDRTAFVPDANFGVYFTNNHLYAGISALQLFQSPLRFSSDLNGPGFKMLRHYYLTAGYRFEVSEGLLLEPSFLFKSTEEFVAQVDVNLKAYIGENYWLGASYRSGGSYGLVEKSLAGNGSAAVFMGGIKMGKIYVGYAFDYTFSAIGARTLGSHEIMAALKFGDNVRRYRWLNRY
jgi:type IX secretion system PorP/SprF family membrane protein